MSTVSVAMIARNGAGSIQKSLKSVEWADEIVVLDCQSTDDTGAIARACKANVFNVPNVANLNVNKNKAIDACSGDWVLVLDADEQIPDALAGEIRRTVDENKYVGYLIPRRNYVLGRWLRYGSQYPDYQLRLFRRGLGRFPASHVHERIAIQGGVGRLTAPMHHFPYPDMTTVIEKGCRYSLFEANYLRDQGLNIQAPKLIFLVMFKVPLRFLRRYLLKGGIFDGAPGLIMACFDAWNHALRWMLLWGMKANSND